MQSICKQCQIHSVAENTHSLGKKNTLQIQTKR